MLAEQPPTEVACGNHGTLRILGAVELQVRGDWGPALKHKFYVLPSFPANIYCIVGIDLMKKLNIELKNVPKGLDRVH